MILSCSFCQWLNLVSISSFSHWRFWQVADNCSTSRPLALRRLSILYSHKRSNCKSKDHLTHLSLHKKLDLPLNYLLCYQLFYKRRKLSISSKNAMLIYFVFRNSHLACRKINITYIVSKVFWG